MDQDKIEEGMLVAQEGMFLNKIDIQMLLQLLVGKGVITREEVTTKREYVSKQPKYKNSLNAIHKLQEKNIDDQHFSEEFTKFLKSDKQDGDINYIKEKLGINSQIIKNSKDGR